MAGMIDLARPDRQTFPAGAPMGSIPHRRPCEQGNAGMLASRPARGTDELVLKVDAIAVGRVSWVRMSSGRGPFVVG